MSNDYLSHHGIKGMKWGVRRTPAQLGHRVTSIANKVKNTPSKKKKQSEAIKKMSDEELRKRINRIQMEKQYKQLTQRETLPGEKFVKDIVTTATKQTAQQYTSKAMIKGVKMLIKAAIR